MKTSYIKIAVGAVAAAGVVAGAVTAAVFAEKKHQLKKCRESFTSLPGDMTVTAHSGCMGTVQNSLESAEVGVENGDIIEVDVRFLTDGTPILSHDAPNGNVPTLDEAFAIVAKDPKCQVNLDLKVLDENLPAVEELAEKHGILSRVFFTGVEPWKVEDVKKYCPNIPYYLNLDVKKWKNQDRAYFDDVIKQLRETGSIGLNTGYRSISKEMIDAIHAAGFMVSLYTVNDELAMFRTVAKGPDNITTRRPDRLNNLGR